MAKEKKMRPPSSGSHIKDKRAEKQGSLGIFIAPSLEAPNSSKALLSNYPSSRVAVPRASFNNSMTRDAQKLHPMQATPFLVLWSNWLSAYKHPPLGKLAQIICDSVLPLDDFEEPTWSPVISKRIDGKLSMALVALSAALRAPVACARVSELSVPMRL